MPNCRNHAMALPFQRHYTVQSARRRWNFNGSAFSRVRVVGRRSQLAAPTKDDGNIISFKFINWKIKYDPVRPVRNAATKHINFRNQSILPNLTCHMGYILGRRCIGDFWTLFLIARQVFYSLQFEGRNYMGIPHPDESSKMTLLLWIITLKHQCRWGWKFIR